MHRFCCHTSTHCCHINSHCCHTQPTLLPLAAIAAAAQPPLRSLAATAAASDATSAAAAAQLPLRSAEHLGHHTCTHCTPTLADSKPKAWLHGNRCHEFEHTAEAVTWHDHGGLLRQVHGACGSSRGCSSRDVTIVSGSASTAARILVAASCSCLCVHTMEPEGSAEWLGSLPSF